MEISNQKSGDNSTNLQAGGAITVNNNSVALFSIEEFPSSCWGRYLENCQMKAKNTNHTKPKIIFQALF